MRVSSIHPASKLMPGIAAFKQSTGQFQPFRPFSGTIVVFPPVIPSWVFLNHSKINVGSCNLFKNCLLSQGGKRCRFFHGNHPGDEHVNIAGMTGDLLHEANRHGNHHK
jgi:hypothetical protein